MHKTRRNAVAVYIQSFAQGSLGTVTNIGRDIQSKAFEKDRIERCICSRPILPLWCNNALFHIPSFAFHSNCGGLSV